jgi:hypothetical protein
MLDELAPSALQTERLRLRPLAPGDAARLAELANDYDVVKTTGGMPFPYALEDAERFIRRAAEADPAREVHFAVELAGEGPIGCVGFYPPPSVLGPELGYWIGRPYWGPGRATSGASAASSPAITTTTRLPARRWSAPASSTPARSSPSPAAPAANRWRHAGWSGWRSGASAAGASAAVKQPQ